jgi:hypothetical protein
MYKMQSPPPGMSQLPGCLTSAYAPRIAATKSTAAALPFGFVDAAPEFVSSVESGAGVEVDGPDSESVLSVESGAGVEVDGPDSESVLSVESGAGVEVNPSPAAPSDGVGNGQSWRPKRDAWAVREKSAARHYGMEGLGEVSVTHPLVPVRQGTPVGELGLPGAQIEIVGV